MSEWSDGYVTSLGYTYNYYSEFNPTRITLPLLYAGIRVPEITTACELGFGQGISLNIHAAAGKTDWYGNDFNPAQAAFAADLAKITGAKVSDESFAEYCNRSDLPDFDFIALHGIWSWVSDENRQHILSFIRRKLKPGGVVYVSYNTSPGWAALMPIRELMTEYIRGNCGGVVSEENMSAAIAFVEQLLATNPLYFRLNPTIKDLLKIIKAERPAYLAHEYFNRDWEPVPFGAVYDRMAGIKCEYACPADHMRHIDSLEMTDAQMEAVKNVTHPVLKETARNFLSYRQFRRDLFVKGIRRLSNAERMDTIRGLRLILARDAADVELKVKSRRGDMFLPENIYMPVIEALADHTVKTVGELGRIISGKLSTDVFLQVLMVLCGQEHVHLMQDDAAIAEARDKTAALNKRIFEIGHHTGGLGVLASPVTGGGYGVSPINQFFVQAVSAGLGTPEKLAVYVAETAEKTGRGIYKDGKPLGEGGKADPEIMKQADVFIRKELPVLRALGIV